MTRDQKILLRPHADHYMAMSKHIREIDDETRAALLTASEAATETNCGWDTYAAAQFLKNDIKAFNRWLAKRGDSSTGNEAGK